MDKTVKIMHIDPDYKITYFINHEGVLIYSRVSLEQAIFLLKTQELDLILSEPHHKAILNPRGDLKQLDLNFFEDQSPLKTEDVCYGENEKSRNVLF